MKPRIRWLPDRRVWVCRSLMRVETNGLPTFWVLLGHGYTPAEAYRDWLQQQ